MEVGFDKMDKVQASHPNKLHVLQHELLKETFGRNKLHALHNLKTLIKIKVARIFDSTCVVDRLKTYKKLIQVIERN